MFSYSQEWIIIDVLEQSKKQLVYKIDNGEEVVKKVVKNPSIVKLIREYHNQGFRLEAVTQGLELVLNSNITQIQTLVLKRLAEILTTHLMRYVEEF